MHDTKRYSYTDLDGEIETKFNTTRGENQFSQSLRNSTNEMFETKLIQKYKNKGNSGVSIMSGETDKLMKSHIRTYDREKVPYAGSAIDISQPDVYRYEVNRRLSRNELPTKTLIDENRSKNDLNLSKFYPINGLTQTFTKSRNATMLKKINSMERILEWQPRGVHKLNLINGNKNISMQKSLNNIIPYREKSNGKHLFTVFLIF
jgi:hypothetical protein